MQSVSRSHYLDCAPDIGARLFGRGTHRRESISCEPGLRSLQANGFEARSDDGQKACSAHEQTSIALRKAVPRFGLTPE
jgi:hypothetical protein